MPPPPCVCTFAEPAAVNRLRALAGARGLRCDVTCCVGRGATTLQVRQRNDAVVVVVVVVIVVLVVVMVAVVLAVLVW